MLPQLFYLAITANQHATFPVFLFHQNHFDQSKHILSIAHAVTFRLLWHYIAILLTNNHSSLTFLQYKQHAYSRYEIKPKSITT